MIKEEKQSKYIRLHDATWDTFREIANDVSEERGLNKPLSLTAFMDEVAMWLKTERSKVDDKD